MVGIAEREPDQDFSTTYLDLKTVSSLPGPREPVRSPASSGLACVARERHHRAALCGAELGPRVHELAPLLERLSEANQKISTLTAGMKWKQIKAPAIQSQIDAILRGSGSSSKPSASSSV